jgi:acyl-CoA thioesterase
MYLILPHIQTLPVLPAGYNNVVEAVLWIRIRIRNNPNVLAGSESESEQKVRIRIRIRIRIQTLL